MPKGHHATLLTYGLPQMPQGLLDAWEEALRDQQAMLTERLREVEAEQAKRRAPVPPLDCDICHHAYPALRVCSRCGPGCPLCQQALDAARFAWLAAHATFTEDHGGRHWRIALPRIGHGWDVHTAVDQAMRKQEEG